MNQGADPGLVRFCKAFTSIPSLFVVATGLSALAIVLSLLVGGPLSSRTSWAAGGFLVDASSGARFLRTLLPVTPPVFGEISALGIVSAALLAGFVGGSFRD
jgi:hypothetical protein